MSTNTEEIINNAKKLRGRGDMVGCLKLLSENKLEATGEVARLRANALIDLDMPYSACNSLEMANPYKITDTDKVKNLDVEARILFKVARYKEAVAKIRQKMEVSLDNGQRELPVFLWLLCLADMKDDADQVASAILVNKPLSELSCYQLKSLMLYDLTFGYNKYQMNPELIERCLNALEDPEEDYGPWCYILALIGYQNSQHIVNKFHEHKYYFESTIVLGTQVPKEFIEMRKAVCSFMDIDERDLKRDYSHIDTYVAKATSGLFPL